MKKRLKVAVLMGGKSPEHDISLLSGKEVVKNLDSNKYQVVSIVIDRDGKNLKFKIENLKLDLAFIAMHGPFGEDGTIQGFLDLIEVPYTGSKVLASALGMDKIYSRKLFTQVGLKTPNFIVIKRGQNRRDIFKKFKLPVFVKPHNQGSSIGTTKVNKMKHLKNALDLAFSFSHLALVEEFIDGIEVTCAIIGNDKPETLPLVEIVPKKEFFDWEAKYNEKLCDEIVPARVSKALTKKTQKAALAAYQALGCQGFGRADMIVKDNDVYVLEVNTIPGLTSVSLLPKAAKTAGISYPQLLDKIISFAVP